VHPCQSPPPPLHRCQQVQAPALQLRWAARLADPMRPRRHGRLLQHGALQCAAVAQPAVEDPRQAALWVIAAVIQLAGPVERAAAEGSLRATWRIACAAGGARHAASRRQAAHHRHQRRMLPACPAVRPAHRRSVLWLVLLQLHWRPQAWLRALETLQQQWQWAHLLVGLPQLQRRPLQVPWTLALQQRMRQRQQAALAVVAGADHCCPLPAETPAQDTKLL
jgi:hypothetical protein